MKCREKNIRRAQCGFTLPEVLVVICLTSLLLSFFLQCFFTVSNQHKQRTALLELTDNMMLAMELMHEDISKSLKVQACMSDQLVLCQGKDLTVYYSLGEDQQADEHFYDLKGNVFYRRWHAQENRQPMANFIDELTFSYLDQYGQLTTVPNEVCAVHVKVTGNWKERQLKQEQIIRLAGTVYL